MLNSLNIVAIEIIEQCNLFCSFCVRNASYNLKNKLSIDQFETIIQHLKRFEKTPDVALTGGEPFMHDKLDCLLDVLENHAIRYSITTNGTVWPKKVINKLKNSRQLKHLIISLDSANESVHNKIRQGKDSYAKTIKFAQIMHEFYIPFGINMTVSPDNYNDVESTIKLAKSLGARDISIATVKPEGRGDLLLNEQELWHIAKQILACESMIDAGFKIIVPEVTFFLYDKEKFSNLIHSNQPRACAFGQESLHIRTNGDILGCTSCELSLDNIFQLQNAGLEHLWANHPTLNNVRNKELLSGMCGDCEFKNICGGCRCRAYGVYGDLHAEDPGCIKIMQNRQHQHV